MKVRWTNDSIRLRITPAELDALLRDEAVAEALHLPGGVVWEAIIRPSPSDVTRLDGDVHCAVIYLSSEDRSRLADEASEGVYFPEGDHGVRYFIEKDFPCVHPRAIEAMEPTSETFSPPDDFAERKSAA